MALTTRRLTRDLVAIILAIGLCTAMNIFTFAVLYDAVFSQGPGLSENATQILTGWGGGIIGILGAVFGYDAGRAHTNPAQDEEQTRPEPESPQGSGPGLVSTPR